MADALTEVEAARTELQKSTYWPAAQKQKGTNHLWQTDVHLAAAIADLQPTPPPGPTPSGGVNVTTPDQTVTSLAITNPAGLGVNVYKDAVRATISDCEIGPTKDSSILLQTHTVGDHHVLRVKMHDSNADGGMSYGVHGIYDAAKGTLVEACESWNHPNGECYSPRWPNTYLRCKAHDGAWLSAFDFSDGTGGLLRIREFIGWNAKGGALYLAAGRGNYAGGGTIGPNTFGFCVDHCVFDLRGSTDTINLSELLVESWLTNSIVVTDNAGWLRKPAAAALHLDGTVVVASADFGKWLNADYSPKQVAGSPLVGKAVASPAAMAEFGKLANVGAL